MEYYVTFITTSVPEKIICSDKDGADYIRFRKQFIREKYAAFIFERGDCRESPQFCRRQYEHVQAWAKILPGCDKVRFGVHLILDSCFSMRYSSDVNSDNHVNILYFLELTMDRSNKSMYTIILCIIFSTAGALFSQKSYPACGEEKLPGFRSDILIFLHQDLLEWYLPIDTKNRQSLQGVELTHIGSYGLLRKARPGIPAHLHTGVDLKRPNNNYRDAPIFPVAKGKVISLRDDGPYAQIIIQHTLADSASLWTVYEHIAGIQTRLHESVDPHRPIARFMTREELHKYGWQFDHVHLEIMRVEPQPRMPDQRRPSLHYGTYCLVCYTQADLDERYYDPLNFLLQQWENNLSFFLSF